MPVLCLYQGPNEGGTATVRPPRGNNMRHADPGVSLEMGSIPSTTSLSSSVILSSLIVRGDALGEGPMVSTPPARAFVLVHPGALANRQPSGHEVLVREPGGLLEHVLPLTHAACVLEVLI